ncbi:MAG: ATP-binding cassette domain-containing protein [Bacilli bacterium]|nr:ATP-binding cassette domain-containing protein [Bacilli bacterium]
MADKILEVKDLVINFKTDNGLVQAVRNVSFDLHRGETLCIVGESGSGKSVTSKAIMGILSNNAIIENGSIMYEGENLVEVSEEEFHRIRGHKIGMIFQDPLSSLNPIVRIGKQITEAMLINSDKLKVMYENIIAPQKVAYRNAVTKKKNSIEKAKHKCELAFDKLDKEYASKKASIKETSVNDKEAASKALAVAKAELKNGKAEAIVKRNNAIKEAIQEFNTVSPVLLKELNEAKAKAKVEVNAYKAKCDGEWKDFQVNWKERMNSAEQAHDVELMNKLEEEKNQYQLNYEAEVKKSNEEFNKRVADLKAKQEATEIFRATKEHEFNTRLKKDERAEWMKQWKVRFNEAKEGPAIVALKKEYKEEKSKYIDKLRLTKAAAKERAIEVMREVGIPLPEKRFKQYPFEFSGGMRQRIVIAIALIATPEILICDEPTTALDVTIQAQILELIKKLQKERNISVIFITHDLGVVANMADRVAVMYAGKIVEYGLVDEVFFEPKHPYTWALLSSIPDVDSKERLDAIPGTPPNMIYPPKGDAFALRSKYALNIDFEEEPPFFKISDTHYAATWLLHPKAPKVEMPKIVSERIKNATKGLKPAAKKEVAAEVKTKSTSTKAKKPAAKKSKGGASNE